MNDITLTQSSSPIQPMAVPPFAFGYLSFHFKILQAPAVLYSPSPCVIITGRELTKWFRSSNMLEHFPSFCEDEDDFDFGDPLSTMIEVDMPRFSILSSDSGIEKDLPPGDDTFSVSSLDTNSPSPLGEPSK